MSAHPTVEQIETAIASLQAMIDAARDGDMYGDPRAADAVMAAAAGPELLKAAEPFEKALRISNWSMVATRRDLADDASMQTGFAWSENGQTRTLTWGDLRALAAAAAKARGE